MRLRNLIGEIGAKYDRRLPMSSEAQTLLREARVEFEQWIPAGYRADGGGKGSAAVTPRIAIFNTDETVTTRHGIYLAYVFAADMRTVTLTLNQGLAEIAQTLGRPRARRTLAWQAAELRAALKADDVVDLDLTFDLGSKTPLAVDYQQANILARTYRLKDLPSERKMVADLQRFIRLYAVAVKLRRSGRLPSSQATDTVVHGATASTAAAKRRPKNTDEHRRRPGGRAGRAVRTKLTRRGLFVALAAVPAAFIAPATIGKEPHRQEKTKTPAPPDIAAPQFTLDVSQHDWSLRGGNLDWVAVRKAGIAGMCARATYGDPSGFHYPSYYFGQFLNEAKKADLHLRGGYHNLVRGNQASINRQVDWLRRELDAYEANWAMVDIERYAELVSNNLWPRWDDVRRFDDRWATVDERVLVGYLPPWNWDKHLGHPDLRTFRGPLISSNYPLKHYADTFKHLYARCGGSKGVGWASYGHRVSEGWQYSSRAKVPGAAAVCDINAWRLSFNQLHDLLLTETT